MTFSRTLIARRFRFMARLGLVGAALASNACSGPAAPDATPKRAASVVVLPAAAPARVEAVVAAGAPPSASALSPSAPNAAASGLSNGARAVAASVAPVGVTAQTKGDSKVVVKRFVVATGVQDREPLFSTDALPSDGTPIYAFAEVANLQGESENVRVTFERKGTRERVGDVTLPIPSSTPRHRTWAFTRYIRTGGVWDAVLWSEDGTELSRTSFEVKAS